MKRNENPFLNVGDRELRLDLVLVEFRHPILFTCLDESGTMYLATCFRADAQERCWLIAETTPQEVIALLRNRISIREAFPSGKAAVYYAEQTLGKKTPVVKRCRAEEVPETCFPTSGMFMDGDEEEFQEELAVLERRVRHSVDFGYSSSAVRRPLMRWRSEPAFQMSYKEKKDAGRWTTARGETINREMRACYG